MKQGKETGQSDRLHHQVKLPVPFERRGRPIVRTISPGNPVDVEGSCRASRRFFKIPRLAPRPAGERSRLVWSGPKREQGDHQDPD